MTSNPHPLTPTQAIQASDGSPQPTPPPAKRRPWLALLLYLLAACFGIGAAWWSVKHGNWGEHIIRVGAWTGSTLSGSTDADAKTRARVALTGLLALGRAETMYFLATEDDQGQTLQANCRYQVRGLPPTARWWSITAYAQDLFLFDAPNGRYSLNGTTAALDASGYFELVTGPSAPTNAAPHQVWLPTPGAQRLVLTLRLYNPAPPLQAAPNTLVPPTITRMGSCA